MQTTLKVLLFLAACILTFLCVKSISGPVRFTLEREKREQAIMQRMKYIREAEISFFASKGFYAGNFETLISFIKADSLFLKQNNIDCSLDSVRFIPYSNGKVFILQTGEVTSDIGENIVVYEVKAPFESYLNDLNKQETERLKLEAIRTGNYPGLRMGADSK